jgi:dihydrofolate synthase/folylpolyglutamate synthase
LTGLALCYFVRRKTDIVVLETGLGGRLDATNAVDAVVNGITPISLDHTALLGRSIKKIAAEKAAIIKNSKSGVVIGVQPAEAMQVIKSRCRSLGIEPLLVGKDIVVSQTAAGFSVTTPTARYSKLKTTLEGEHQLRNAAMAVGMVELSGLKITPKAVAQGIGQTRWPCRFEVVGKNPAVVVDCAHNTASAEVLARSLRRSFPGKKIILVLGLSNDKDIEGICAVLGRHARLVITTQSRHPRAYQFLDIAMKKLFKGKSALNVGSIDDAMKIARREATGQDVIVAAGSVFIAAEARALFKG